MDGINRDHAALCSSEEWALYIRDEVLPRAVGDLSLGDRVLEIGPGYGAATRWLVSMVVDLTVIEPDRGLAADLDAAFPAVTVVRGSGADMSFDDDTFTAVVCFTMLHHVPSRTEQDALFAETVRVLRPGGLFVGSDSVASPDLAAFHHGDTYVPVDPETLPARLTAAGFADVDVQVSTDVAPLLTFTASTPPG